VTAVGIGFVCGRIVGIGFGKRLLDFMHHRLGILRIQPDMGVEFAVVVTVVTSLGGLVVIVVMVNFGRLVVIVIVLRLCGMRMIVMTRFIAVIVLLEGAALAEAKLHQIVGIDQLYRFRVRANGLQWLFKESLKFVPDPEHDIWPDSSICACEGLRA
jgi:hypothetical protein